MFVLDFRDQDLDCDQMEGCCSVEEKILQMFIELLKDKRCSMK